MFCLYFFSVYNLPFNFLCGTFSQPSKWMHYSLFFLLPNAAVWPFSLAGLLFYVCKSPAAMSQSSNQLLCYGPSCPHLRAHARGCDTPPIPPPQYVLLFHILLFHSLLSHPTASSPNHIYAKGPQALIQSFQFSQPETTPLSLGSPAQNPLIH